MGACFDLFLLFSDAVLPMEHGTTARMASHAMSRLKRVPPMNASTAQPGQPSAASVLGKAFVGFGQIRWSHVDRFTHGGAN